MLETTLVLPVLPLTVIAPKSLLKTKFVQEFKPRVIFCFFFRDSAFQDSLPLIRLKNPTGFQAIKAENIYLISL